MNSGTRGQAAADYIITYGWAIFSVIAVIAVLGFFGILSPEKFFPENCVFTQPAFKCVSGKVESDTIALVVLNAQARDITVNSIKVNECSSSSNTAMAQNSQATFEIKQCSNGARQDKFKGNIELKYTEKDSGLARAAYGVLKGNVE